ncbi:MAG TPA: TetR/AcrR family transcriptional regulator [Anaerolineae bacterium]|jgi:AcrR family transcriptional regulator
MARKVIAVEYTDKRNQILDVAQKLIYTNGYEQMSIQDIVDELKISKGAFYHYFDSKPALLDALVDRVESEAETIIYPILNDASLDAIGKLQAFFDATGRWKTAQKTYLLALTRILYSDDNVLYRTKMVRARSEWFIPRLAEIIREGVAEGLLDNQYPEQTAAIILAIVMELGEAMISRLLMTEPQDDDLAFFESAIAAYTVALERVLGIRSGSIRLMESESIREWVAMIGVKESVT